MVPHLTTSLPGPLRGLERLVLERRPDIEHWVRNHSFEVEARAARAAAPRIRAASA